MSFSSTMRRLVGASVDKPNRLRRARETYTSLRNRFQRPVWVDHPVNIQLEITNYCNLWMCGKGCIHCNVKPAGGWNLPRGVMSDEIIRYVVEYWGKHGALTVAPYINGEYLLDNRCKWISDLCQENGLAVVIDTNGTLYDKRAGLVHPNNRQVRFSYSATTPETYEIVHGADLYREATATIEWFLKHREATQYPMLYYITDKYNLHELDDYIKRWRGKCHIVVYPLHEVDGIQTESTKTKADEENYWDKITVKYTGKQCKQPFRPIDITPDGNCKSRVFPRWLTCQGSTSFSVNWQGLILHCTDIPYSYNYGSCFECDMLTVWHERNHVKMLGHPACEKCNVKSPEYKRILQKYIK